METSNVGPYATEINVLLKESIVYDAIHRTFVKLLPPYAKFVRRTDFPNLSLLEHNVPQK